MYSTSNYYFKNNCGFNNNNNCKGVLYSAGICHKRAVMALTNNSNKQVKRKEQK